MSGLIEQLETIAQNITVTRYFGIAGYTILLYDWLLTLSDEIELIWWSKRNWVKWVYLVQKYLVMVILLLVNIELSGLSGIEFSDQFCRGWLVAHITYSTISIQIANAIVLLQVNELWDHKRLIGALLFWTLGGTTVATIITLSVGVAKLINTVGFIPGFNFCAPSFDANVHFMASVWGIPLACNIIIIIMTALNALDRPRNMDVRVATILAQDGLFYFVGLCILHTFNVLMIAFAPTSLVFCGGYFAWSLVTMLMNRFVINVQRRELIYSMMVSGGRTSPFGIPLSSVERQSSYFDDGIYQESNVSTLKSKPKERPRVILARDSFMPKM